MDGSQIGLPQDTNIKKLKRQFKDWKLGSWPKPWIHGTLIQPLCSICRPKLIPSAGMRRQSFAMILTDKTENTSGRRHLVESADSLRKAAPVTEHCQQILPMFED